MKFIFLCDRVIIGKMLICKRKEKKKRKKKKEKRKKKKRKLVGLMMWLSRSVVTINTTLQLLDILTFKSVQMHRNYISTCFGFLEKKNTSIFNKTEKKNNENFVRVHK